MAEQDAQGEIVREVHLKISPQYANIAVVPKEGEKGDKNFPHNLHNAAELFLRVGIVDNAEKLKVATDKMISIYAENPNGSTGMRIGDACVCWNCGFCGIPQIIDEKSIDEKVPGPCFECGEKEQINWLRIKQKQGTNFATMPWIEVAPLSEEEAEKKKDAEIAAKRAEVEARVKQVLAARAAPESSK